MKIAVITDDGRLISRHFGRAPYYLVLTVENGQVVGRETRPKLGHTQFSGEGHSEEPHGSGHGMDSASHDRHARMAGNISNCQAIICGGMGMGARECGRSYSIFPLQCQRDCRSPSLLSGGS